MNYSDLESLRALHPAWRLLRADNAPLIASFLHRAFVMPNARVIAAADLEEMLEDVLFALRAQAGEGAFSRSSRDYLNDWAQPEKGWLRKFYAKGSDEAQYDLTPSTEKAIVWLESLSARSFVGTESRLLTLFELLKQLKAGTETDLDARIAALEAERKRIDIELVRTRAGDVATLDDTALKDRFQQFLQVARELLGDFREVEHNFRLLDRSVRERIALWEGSKGALLDAILGERDAISGSDQGRSFRAFWDFLMSSQRQDDFGMLLDHALTLPAVQALKPEPRVRRVHYDWLEAGEHTQRTVAQLSQQLRRFLDDRAWLENRRIMDILHGIESKGLSIRDAMPVGEVMSIADVAADIDLPFERPLFAPAPRLKLAALALDIVEEDIDADALYHQIVIDKAQLARHIRQMLQLSEQLTLREIIDAQPLTHGLGELVAYLQLGEDAFHAVIDEAAIDSIDWMVDASLTRRVRLPRVIFRR